MRIITESAIEVSESLAAFITASYFSQTRNCDPIFEKRMKHVDTARFTIADIYLASKDVAFEVKSVEHGTSALKGLIQSSIYKEQAENSIFVMQKPRRDKLSEAIEKSCQNYGIGVIWLVGIPNICDEKLITSATGGCSKPFELWKKRRYSMTKGNIIARSRSDWIQSYIETLESIILEREEDIFDFCIKPDPQVGGFSDKY